MSEDFSGVMPILFSLDQFDIWVKDSEMMVEMAAVVMRTLETSKHGSILNPGCSGKVENFRLFPNIRKFSQNFYTVSFFFILIYANVFCRALAHTHPPDAL